MAEEVTQSTINNQEENEGSNLFVFSWFSYLITVEQNMESTTKESQINVVDDATLQAILSSMTEPEVHAFLDELNKTGKACKSF